MPLPIPTMPQLQVSTESQPLPTPTITNTNNDICTLFLIPLTTSFSPSSGPYKNTHHTQTIHTIVNSTKENTNYNKASQNSKTCLDSKSHSAVNSPMLSKPSKSKIKKCNTNNETRIQPLEKRNLQLQQLQCVRQLDQDPYDH